MYKRRLGSPPRTYAVTWSAPAIPHATPTPRLGSRVTHCDDQGTWAQSYLDSGTNAPRSTARAKVSHRSAKATAPQARYTSSLTMAGVSHQGSLALKKS